MYSFDQIISKVRKVEGWLSDGEAHLLFTLARGGFGAGEIVEIGSYKGKSTICLAAGSKSLKREKVTAIDPHKGIIPNEIDDGKPTYKEFVRNLDKVSLKDWVRPIVKTSEEAAVNWKKPIRLLFIDGLHDYQHAYQDYSLWEPYVARGGVIVFHDAYYGHSGPVRVFEEEVLGNNKFSNLGLVGYSLYASKFPTRSIVSKISRLRFRIFIPIANRVHSSSLNKTIKYLVCNTLIRSVFLSKNSFRYDLVPFVFRSLVGLVGRATKS